MAFFQNLYTIARDGVHTSMPEGEIQLKEVEEQLQNIFTPTPIELLRVSLSKARDKEDFGFSLSDGVFEKGVYVSAIRPGGPASSKLKPFDRILQVCLLHCSWLINPDLFRKRKKSYDSVHWFS